LLPFRRGAIDATTIEKAVLFWDGYRRSTTGRAKLQPKSEVLTASISIQLQTKSKGSSERLSVVGNKAGTSAVVRSIGMLVVVLASRDCNVAGNELQIEYWHDVTRSTSPEDLLQSRMFVRCSRV
jgi:hypothetical protein